MNFTRKMTVSARIGVIAVTAVSAVACAHSSTPAAPPQHAAADEITVPSQLAVPPGQQLIATLNVDHGSQVYTCKNGAWVLKEPAAVLKSGSEEALHTAGPQWISTNDGSAVTGTTSATVQVKGAVPELLLTGSANRGKGIFGTVDFIQRLNTHGGVAPSGTCTDGAQQAVGYSAQYRFYSQSAHRG
jgi:uncharacterized protein DUF3455